MKLILTSILICSCFIVSAQTKPQKLKPLANDSSAVVIRMTPNEFNYFYSSLNNIGAIIDKSNIPLNEAKFIFAAVDSMSNLMRRQYLSGLKK